MNDETEYGLSRSVVKTEPIVKMTSNVSSVERKRLRDRVAQQNLRDKRNRHIQALEQQVELCRQLHRTQDNDKQLLDTVKQLRQENAALRERQNRLIALIKSCKDILGESMHLESSHTHQTRPSEQPQQAITPGSSNNLNHKAQNDAQKSTPNLNRQGSPCSHHLPHNQPTPDPDDSGDSCSNLSEKQDTNQEIYTSNTHTILNSHESEISDRVLLDYSHAAGDSVYPATPDNFEPSVSSKGPDIWDVLDFWAEKSFESLPPWACVPLRTLTLYDANFSPWDSDIRVILDAPDVPSPLDLLFGSKKNPLASAVHRRVKIWYQGDPERLAIGWLTYHYIKWRTQPSAERYLRLPNCMKPAPEQIESPHPGCLDVILWKKLRINILKNHTKYDIFTLIHHYCSCLKLRWAGNEEFLVPDEKERYNLRPEFFRCFMSEDGWGLSSEFVSQYPEFFEGLDLRKVIYT